MKKIFYGLTIIILSQFLAFNASAWLCQSIDPDIDKEQAFSDCLQKILDGREDSKKHPRWLGKLDQWLKYWQEALKYIEMKIRIYPDSPEGVKRARQARLEYCQLMIAKCEKLLKQQKP